MAKYDYGSLKMGSATSTKRMRESTQRMQAQVTAVQNIVQDSKRQDIPYDQLIRYADNRDNDDENIDDLVQSIKTIGFQSTILVRKVPHEMKYEILSGHRRWRAFGQLLKEDPKFEEGKMPCIVLPEDTSDKLAKMANILLNLETVSLTPKQKRQAVVDLSKLMEEGGKLPMEKAEYIAQKLNTSTLTVFRYRKFDNKLIPELGELMDSEYITQNQCEEFSRLTESNQVLVFQTLLKQIQNNEQRPSIDADILEKMITDDKQIQKEDAARDKKIENIENKIAQNKEKLDDPTYTGQRTETIENKIRQLTEERDFLLEERVKAQKRESEAARSNRQTKKTISEALKTITKDNDISDNERAMAIAYSDKLTKLNQALNNMSTLIYRDKTKLNEDQISKLEEVSKDIIQLIKHCKGK